MILNQPAGTKPLPRHDFFASLQPRAREQSSNPHGTDVCDGGEPGGEVRLQQAAGPEWTWDPGPCIALHQRRLRVRRAALCAC
ncbi:hypothetical protein JMJ77_0009222, partial [Colletotrichum scovillei]